MYTAVIADGGDIVAGVKLGYYLSAAGYQSIQIKPISQFHDLRNPKLRAEMANYLYNLLMSGKEELLNAQLITPEIIAALPAEFEQLCHLEEAIIHYPGFQGKAIV